MVLSATKYRIIYILGENYNVLKKSSSFCLTATVNENVSAFNIPYSSSRIFTHKWEKLSDHQLDVCILFVPVSN